MDLKRPYLKRLINKLYLVLLLSELVLYCQIADAQNGRIIERHTVIYPDSITMPLVKRLPRFRKVLDSTQL